MSDGERKRNAILVYNPKAGSATEREDETHTIERFLEERLGYAVQLLPVERAREDFNLEEQVQALGGVDLVVAMGGDGTVGGVLEAAARSRLDVPVGVVPIGTSNLLSRSLGVYPMKLHRSLVKYATDLYGPNKPNEHVVEYAMNILASGKPVKIDLAEANGVVLATGVGVGPIASAMAAPDSTSKKSLGMVAYALAMLRQLRNSHRRFLIKIDEEEPFEAEAMGVYVSNLPNLGIGTPEHLDEMQDGLLDLFVVDCHNIFDFFKVWVKYFAWIFSNERRPPYLYRRVRRVRVTALEDAATPSIAKPKVAIDGDPSGQGPLDAQVIPKAVTVYVPHWIAAHLEAKIERRRALAARR